MKRFALITSGMVLLSGCAAVQPEAPVSEVPLEVTAVGEGGPVRPAPRPAGLNTTPSAPAVRPPSNARTAAQFDTTSAAEKQAAVAAAEETAESGEGKALGRTVASLGDPSQPGLWIKTPLVSTPSKGRVVYPANGKSVELDLIPIDGPKTAGSRMSLAALRVLEAPLTELPEIEVFLN